ncbi:MAG: hypothetical protein LQ341_006271 [Variospora aurantia]|nr:MAG: hypothetical protein LQ341_006271 [Variospora aurantia]
MMTTTAINESINPPVAIESIPEALRASCMLGRTDEVRHCLQRWKSMPTPVPRRPPKRPNVHLQPAVLVAVNHNHLSTVALLLDEGFRIAPEAVQIALVKRSTAMLQTFIDHGWNINKRLVEFFMILTWFAVAARRASLEVIQILVQHGGRVYPGNALPAAAKTSLPDRTHVLAYFLDQGAPIDTIEYDFKKKVYKVFGVKAFGTALHHAAKGGNEQLVRFLLERGAKVSLEDSMGKTALQYARELDHAGIVSILEEVLSSSE